MARTVVRVELEHATAEASFATAMADRGFVRTLIGKASRKTKRLPPGMYLIQRKGPHEALQLTREAARAINVRARIFCLPVRGPIRFANLQAG